MKALILGLIAAGLILFFGTAEAVLPDGNLVLHFNFDEGRGDEVKDLSGNGNDGTIVNAQWTDSQFGKALDFDGATTYVNVPANPTLDITDAITLAAWTYPREMETRYIINKVDSSNSGYALIANWEEEWRMIIATNWVRKWAGVPTGSIPFEEWTHVLGTFDSTTIKLYINGELEAKKNTKQKLGNVIGI